MNCMFNTDNTKISPAPEKFGLTTGVFVVVASMIGTGILTTSGFTVASVSSHNWAWILWICGGVLALCGALSQAELVTRIPQSGGDYVILYRAFGPMMGFLSGWVSLVLGFSGPIAASSKAAAAYFLASYPLSNLANQDIFISLIASLIVLFLTWMHSHSHSRSSLTQNLSTSIKLFFLILFLASGLYAGFQKSDIPQDLPVRISPDLLGSSLTSMIYISYAYTGWNAIGFIAGEIQSPQKNLSLSILIGTALVTILYFGLNLVYGLAISVSDLQTIAEKQGFDALAPIAEISASQLFGSTIARGLSLIFALMLISSVSAYLLSGPRIIYAMASSGHFPAWASKLNQKSVPQRATLLQSVLSLVFVWSSSLEGIIVSSGLGLACFSMITIASLFYFRKYQSESDSVGFLCPVYPVVPLIYLLGTGLLVSATFYNKPKDGLVSVSLIMLGILIYFIFRNRMKPIQNSA